MTTIKQIRIRKGLSQDELAALAKVSSMTVWRMEHGTPVSTKKALAVCNALGVDIDSVEGLKLATSRA